MEKAKTIWRLREQRSGLLCQDVFHQKNVDQSLENPSGRKTMQVNPRLLDLFIRIQNQPLLLIPISISLIGPKQMNKSGGRNPPPGPIWPPWALPG